ncbi:MAG TPA: tetratricopeptide repeat protein [Microcoleaceae cyanobacterium]
MSSLTSVTASPLSGMPVSATVSQHVQAKSTQKTIHRIWCSRGKVLTRQGYYEAALTSFDAALQLQPNDHQSWVFRGVVLMHLKRYKAALASFNQALELVADDREVWIFRGAVLTYLNQSEEATKSYQRALSMQQQGHQVCCDYPMWLPPQLQTKTAELAIA